jgi:tetratricopeptide (TPR) repeat protein
MFIIWTLSSCVYYNTYYNAKRQFSLANGRRFESEAEPENRQLANAYLDYYLSAIRKASSVLDLYPDSKWVDDSLLLIGKSYYWRGEHKDAQLKFGELLGNFPESDLRTEALYWRALALWGNEDISESRELLEQIGISDDKTYAWQARLALAELEQSQESYDLAVRNYLSLVDDLDDDALTTRLWKGLGDTYFAQNDYSNALNAYGMVLGSGPDDLTSYQTQKQIGAAQELTDDLDGAMDTYDRLVKAKRFRRYQPKIQLLIANVHRLTGDVDGALLAYEKIISDNPRTEESAEAYYQMGVIEHDVRKNIEGAMELLGKARKERSASDAAVKARDLEKTLFQLDKFKKQAEKDTKKGAEALFSVAEIYLFSLGEVDSALSAYERVLARQDSSDLAAKALYGMGLIYADSLDNQPEANRLFQKLIDGYPVTPYAIDARGRVDQDRSDDNLAEARFIEAEVLKDEGADPQEVITILNQVTEEYPRSIYAPKSLFALAWTYENDLVNPDVASEHYERLVDAYPLTDFAEISRDKIKQIKKEQQEIRRNKAKEKKESEEKEVKPEKVEKQSKTTKATQSNDQKKKDPEATDRRSYESSDTKVDAEPTVPTQPTVPAEPPEPPPKIPEDGPLESVQVDELPELRKAPPPEVREELMEEEDINPTVSVRMLVGRDGKVKRVIVVEGAELLQEAAVDQAFQYQFKPGRHQGKPREVWIEFPITFLKPHLGEQGEPQ